jgi:phosphopantothenoylcysteine decarboxylase/phosphopantothenate--cysteine ligase
MEKGGEPEPAPAWVPGVLFATEGGPGGAGAFKGATAPLPSPRMTRSSGAGRLSGIAGVADGARRLLGETGARVVPVVTRAARDLLEIVATARPHRPDLAGLRVVVTAGPTVEDLDPVRFLGNRSTGKMGFAVAARAAVRGATVTLIAGPVTLPTPFGVNRVDVRGALSMRAALWQALGSDLTFADALVMSAAVADYRPAEQHAQKQKRTADTMTLALVPNPDLLAEIGAARAGARRPVLVGFAVETDTDAQVVAYARGKLDKKRVDLVVANHAGDAFGKDDNRATLVDHAGAEALSVLPKPELADRILDRVARLCDR